MALPKYLISSHCYSKPTKFDEILCVVKRHKEFVQQITITINYHQHSWLPPKYTSKLKKRVANNLLNLQGQSQKTWGRNPCGWGDGLFQNTTYYNEMMAKKGPRKMHITNFNVSKSLKKHPLATKRVFFFSSFSVFFRSPKKAFRSDGGVIWGEFLINK